MPLTEEQVELINRLIDLKIGMRQSLKDEGRSIHIEVMNCHSSHYEKEIALINNKLKEE